MYSYKNTKKAPKRKLIVSLSCLLVVAVTFLTYEFTLGNQQQETPVFKEEGVPVLSIPSAIVKEVGVKPFDVDAKVVLDYFDGKDSKIENITKFEGVYRANQGMDYAFNKENFNVLASFSGVVSDVKEDAVFGKSVTIKSEDIVITYQSVQDINVKKGDKVNQKDTIAKASTNVYNKDIGNHLHIVVEKSGEIIDPQLIFDKALSEIK